MDDEKHIITNQHGSITLHASRSVSLDITYILKMGFIIIWNVLDFLYKTIFVRLEMPGNSHSARSTQCGMFILITMLF